MRVEVAALPALADASVLRDWVAVAIDVFRATTTIAAALHAGVSQIRIFPDESSARKAAAQFSGRKLLCGEVACLPPEGFDLGNSPGAFLPEHAGATLFMSTTNGTKAIITAASASTAFVASLVNAAPLAEQLACRGQDAILVCAGTNGRIAMEDLTGAGAVLHYLRMRRPLEFVSDTPRIALELFRAPAGCLYEALAETEGARNVLAAGLEADLRFATSLNTLPIIGVVRRDPLRIERLQNSPPARGP